MSTEQLKFWKSKFGDNYVGRNNNLITPGSMRRLMRDWGRILNHAVTPTPSSVLEIGCNIGRNLIALSRFIENIHGVEPNDKAFSLAKHNYELAHAVIHHADGFNLPYKNNSIDLVFTSGVLIHVDPSDLDKMINEIYRVSSNYIVCIEYFSHKLEHVKYHGHDGYLFKRDFGKYYLDKYPSLQVLDYGFLWQPLDSSDNSNWWLFRK